MLLLLQGDLTGAERHAGEALACCQAYGDTRNSAAYLVLLGWVSQFRGEDRQSVARWGEAFELGQAIGFAEAGEALVAGIAFIAFTRGEATTAARLLGAHAAQPPDRGQPWLDGPLVQLRTKLKTALSEHDFAAAWDAGQALSLDAAISEAEAVAQRLLSADGAENTRYPDGLSEREVEVLRLVAAGKSNKEIAQTLVITLNTVFRHISNIFTKAGASNRAQAALYAQRRRLASSRRTLLRSRRTDCRCRGAVGATRHPGGASAVAGTHKFL